MGKRPLSPELVDTLLWRDPKTVFEQDGLLDVKKALAERMLSSDRRWIIELRGQRIKELRGIKGPGSNFHLHLPRLRRISCVHVFKAAAKRMRSPASPSLDSNTLLHW